MPPARSLEFGDMADIWKFLFFFQTAEPVKLQTNSEAIWAVKAS
jgi:hypothetical protein